MIIDITCRTDRSRLSTTGPRADQQGEDFSRWLMDALRSRGVDARALGWRDAGWSNQATLDGTTYLVCVAGTDPGEWHVLLERKRSLLQRLTGQDPTCPRDTLVRRIAQVLVDAGMVEVGMQA